MSVVVEASTINLNNKVLGGVGVVGGGGPSGVGCAGDLGKNVTFKVPVAKERATHRRAKSLPYQPLSGPKLLSLEVNQLTKKKVALETGVEIRGWPDPKEKKKLHGAIEVVLDEKRKEQLATIKDR